MESWFSEVINSEQAGISLLFVVLLMGFVSIFSCGCNFAIIGAIAGYSGALSSASKTKTVVWSSIFFLAGTVISMAVIGALIGYAGEIISDSFGFYWKIIAGIISVFFGLYTIDLLPFKLPGISINTSKIKDNFFSAILFGIAMGGLTSACSLCCNPFFPVIMAASFVKGSIFWGVLLLVCFSLGYGLPLAFAIVGLGLSLGKISKLISRFGIILKYIAGIALIITGFYLLITF